MLNGGEESMDKFVNKYTNKEAVSFVAYSYADWKAKEKEVKEKYPNARSTSMPGLGYAGEYWYDIE